MCVPSFKVTKLSSYKVTKLPSYQFTNFQSTVPKETGRLKKTFGKKLHAVAHTTHRHCD